MIWLYFCKTAEKERTLLGLLREKTGIEPHICRNEYGKPYAEGNKIFSIFPTAAISAPLP